MTVAADVDRIVRDAWVYAVGDLMRKCGTKGKCIEIEAQRVKRMFAAAKEGEHGEAEKGRMRQGR
jgi:hypothetical protein